MNFGIIEEKSARIGEENDANGDEEGGLEGWGVGS